MRIKNVLVQSLSTFLWLGCCIASPLLGTWSPPETPPQSPLVTLYTGPGFSTYYDGRVALDPSGNATAVWLTFDSSDNLYRVFASSKPLGGNWQASPDILYESTAVVPLAPSIAVDSNGNATVVWVGYDGSNNVIQSSSKAFGGSWGSPATLSNSGMESLYPTIGVDANGNATAAWLSLIGGVNFIQTATKPLNENWQSAVSLSESLTPPQLAVDSAGNTTIVYVTSAGTNFLMQTIFKPVGGNWEFPVTLISSTLIVGTPQISVGSNGNPTAIWQLQDGPNSYIQSSTRLSTTSWETPVIISTNGQENLPEVFVDRNNNVSAIWISVPGGTPVAQTATRLFGQNWEFPVTLTPTTNVSVIADRITGDANGNVTAVWATTLPGNTYVIQAASKPFGGSWGSISTISEPTTLRQDFPDLAVDPIGNAMAVWGFPAETNPSITVLQDAINLVPPAITHVNPNTGTDTGGTVVTITGTNFIDVTEVLFGSTPASSFQVLSPTAIVAIAPPGTSGTVNITITSSLGNSSITVHDQFTYQHLPPLPPSHFKGKISKRSHEHKHPYTLHAQWKPSQSNVALYRIYKRSKVVDVIQANAKRCFKDHLQWRSSATKFSITAVDSSHAESAHIPLKTHH